MNTCGTCKFRGKPIKNIEEPTTYFLCDLIKQINLSSDSEQNYTPLQGAGVQDGSGYHAALCVENDFGCVKWESK